MKQILKQSTVTILYQLLVSCLFTFHFFNPVLAQSPSCNNFSSECFANPNPAAYTLIEVSSGQTEVTVSQMIGANLLLSQTLATTQPQLIKLRGVLRVDIPYTFINSEIVFLDNTSRIEISSDLEIKGSNLHGCDKMWDGISVNNNSSLLLSQSCVRDAFRAVALLNGSKADIIENAFFRNHTAIYAGEFDGTLPPATFMPIQKGIIGNNIDGSGQLLQPLQGASKPTLGIRVNNLVSIIIGASSGPLNNIHDFTPSGSGGTSITGGLIILNSDVSVNGTVFSNYFDGAQPIFINNLVGLNPNSISSVLKVKGIGKYALPTFSNFNVGIQVAGGAFLDLTECKFTSGFIDVSFIAPIIAHYYNIQNCTFSDFNDNAISSSPGNYGKCNISENIFIDNLNVSNGGQPSAHSAISAIGNVGSLSTQIKPLRIWSNSFDENTKPPAQNTNGENAVLLTNMNGIASIMWNNFSQNHVGTNLHFYRGILLSLSKNNLIEGNNFTGVLNNTTPLSPLGRMAIFADASGLNTIKCNTTTNLNEGIRFTGASCNSTTLQGNSFGDHAKGVFLTNASTVIGKQEYRQNTWPVNTLSPQTEAIFDGGPSDVALSLSEFVIQSPETTAPNLWAKPRVPASWFKFVQPETGLAAPCTGTPGIGNDALKSLSELDKRVVSNTFEPFKGYAATLRDAEFATLSLLDESPELRTNDVDADLFYANKENTSTAVLYRAYRAYGEAVSAPSETLAIWEQLMDTELQLLKDIELKTSELSHTNDASKIYEEIGSLNNAVTAIRSNKSNIINNFLPLKSQRLTNLLSSLNGFTSSNQDENNLKNILLILCNAQLDLVNPGIFNKEQIANITAIAQQCRYEGGFAVDIARSLLYKTSAEYDEPAICGFERTTNSGNNPLSSIDFSPIPATNTLLFRINDAFLDGNILFYDMNGTLVQTSKLVGESNQKIDISRLPQGMFIARVVLDGKIFAIEKLVKI